MAEKPVFIEAFDPEKGEHVHALNSLIQDQEKENTVKFDSGIMDPRKDKKMIKAITDTDAFKKKVRRILDAVKKGTAFAHLAFMKQNMGRETRQVPIGFILSHESLEHPLDQHTRELQEEFPEAKDLEHVLSGEYAFVQPKERGHGIGKRLFDVHEALASEHGYTHRMTSVHPDRTQS
ncbi:MAG: GNAT family N-acetyltransferase, partial [Candidatus Micrarchaeota archaeon]|nr:GNAT family N-acetyltransferase [Candidatus Micrarchaeota archaeon]